MYSMSFASFCYTDYPKRAPSPAAASSSLTPFSSAFSSFFSSCLAGAAVAELGLVDREHVGLVEESFLEYALDVQAHFDRVDLELGEGHREVGGDRVAFLDHDLRALDDDLAAVDGGRDAGLLQLPDDGA